MGSVARFKRIYIEITSSCNLTCSFCQKTLRPAHFMNTQEFAHIISEIKPYTNYVYLHVKGEPLLSPYLEDMLKLCQDNNIRVNITTNGTLLADRIDTLVKYPVHQINISLHSADDNDCIDMDSYIKDIFSSCETLVDKTDTEVNLRLWNTKKDPLLFGNKNCTIKRHLYINVQSPFEWPELNSGYFNERGFCQGLRSHIAILSDGTVVPCCLDGNAIMALGNIFSSHFKDILSNERSQAIIKGWHAKMAVEPLCKHCSFKERFTHKL